MSRGDALNGVISSLYTNANMAKKLENRWAEIIMIVIITIILIVK